MYTSLHFHITIIAKDPPPPPPGLPTSCRLGKSHHLFSDIQWQHTGRLPQTLDFLHTEQECYALKSNNKNMKYCADQLKHNNHQSINHLVSQSVSQSVNQSIWKRQSHQWELSSSAHSDPVVSQDDTFKCNTNRFVFTPPSVLHGQQQRGLRSLEMFTTTIVSVEF